MINVLNDMAQHFKIKRMFVEIGVPLHFISFL